MTPQRPESPSRVVGCQGAGGKDTEEAEDHAGGDRAPQARAIAECV
jgi:hypothetical protein